MHTTSSLLALLLSSSAHAGPPVLPELPPAGVPEPTPKPTPGPGETVAGPSTPAPDGGATEPTAEAASPEAEPTGETTAEPIVTPEPTGEASPPTVAPEPAASGPRPYAPTSGDEHDLPDDDREREPEEGWKRELNGRGVTLGLGLGVGGCGESFCAENPLSVVGRGALGYRLPRVAFVATMSGGGGPRTDLPGSFRLLGADVGVEVFPTGPGKVEPYVGLALGYMRVKQTSVSSEPGGTESDFDVYFARGAVRASVGVPFRLGRRWALGPRFDYTWGFAGRLCGSNSFGSDCQSVANTLDDIAGSDEKVALRAVRRSVLPQPWALTVELRAVF